MATRECAQCGLPFVGQRATAKYCSSGCRVAATRARSRGVGEEKPQPAGRKRTHPLVTATRRELREAGVLNTVAGQRAILCAERAANPAETGNAVVGLSKQLQEAVDAAIASVKRADRMDDIQRRKEEKLREARGA